LVMKYDFKNKRFGKLRILDDVGRAKDRSILWSYLCDCGNTGKIKSKSLVSGAKSCGCLRRIQLGEANFNKLLANYKHWAKIRNLRFNLSKEGFRKLTQQNCFYCGAKPNQKKYRKFSNGAYVFNGIDRKDNQRGYVPGNVVACCLICNRAKGNLSYKEFFSWIQRIAKK